MLKTKFVKHQEVSKYFGHNCKFQGKEAKFLVSNCTKLYLVRIKPVQQNSLYFFKTLEAKCALYQFMKLNLLREMLLFDIFFHKDVKKNQNMAKNLSFSNLRGVFASLSTLSLQKTKRSLFTDYFGFSHFLPTSFFLLIIRN